MLDLSWQIDMDAATFDNLDSGYRIGDPPGAPRGRLLSLSLFGSPAAPRYAAVWQNGGTPREQRLIQGDKTFVQDMCFLLRGVGFTPEIIAATGDGSATHFALVMRRRYAGESAGLVDWDLPLEAFIPANLAADETPTIIQSRRRGTFRLSWAVSYRGKGDAPLPPRVAAVWAPQQAPVYSSTWATKEVAAARWTPWNVEPSDRPRTFQKKFDAHVAGGARLQLVVPYCPSPGCGDGPSEVVNAVASNWLTDPRYLSIWYGDMVGPWWCGVDMDKGQCETLRYAPPPELEGLAPVRLLATGSAKDPRYAVIYATRTDALPKYAKVVKQYTPGSVMGGVIDPGDDLDDAIITTMSRDGIRRGQAAGTVKERLVAARAYTVAEAGYESGRKTGHRDVFRIGSVSKTFTALAIMRLVQDGAIDNLDSPVGPIMGWGGRWRNVSLRRLLTHVSSMRSGDPTDLDYLKRYNVVAATTPPFGGDALPPVTLPLQDSIVYEPLLELGPVAKDGLWVYSNPAFELLGRIVSRRGGNYLAYLKALVEKQTSAQVTRLRASPVALAKRELDEVFHHGGIPAVSRDAVSGTGAWIPSPYGSWNSFLRAPGGGLACAAIDVARVMARVERRPDGILSKESLDAWLWGPESQAPLVPKAKGFIRPGLGWDVYNQGTEPTPLPKQSSMVSKNGNASGSIALLARHYDGRSIAVVFNGNLIADRVGEGAIGATFGTTLLALFPTVPTTFDLFESPNVDPLWAAS